MKTYINKIYLMGLLMSMVFMLTFCDGFFNEKPDLSLVVPQSLDDFQAILDAQPRAMNANPSLGFLGSDDLYLGESVINRMSNFQVSAYFWRKDFYLPDELGNDWYFPYRKVFQANLVLDGLKDYKAQSKVEENRMKLLEASARFYRALGHFEILSLFSEIYDSNVSDQLGIPLRLTSDINQKEGRASQEEVYSQIIEDLEFGMGILPNKPDVPTRPSLWASYSLLSRIHLYKQDYYQALSQAENALSIGKELMDYTAMDSSLTYSFEIFNPEVIHYGELMSGRFTTNAATYVHPEILSLFGDDDLRRFFFFRDTGVDSLKNFRGHYTGSYQFFGGLAVDEVYLNAAEAGVRLGNNEKALEMLNALLINRISGEFYQELENLSGDDLLQKVMEERRKELLFRGNRWLDLKRYNLEEKWKVTLNRGFNAENAELSPGDLRYVLPIPPQELSYNPMEQNPR